jgi:hypothetical protein
MEIRHFLAVPQPPCCSNCVGVKMRRAADTPSQLLHRQVIFMSDRVNTPRVPLHTTAICSRIELRQDRGHLAMWDAEGMRLRDTGNRTPRCSCTKGAAAAGRMNSTYSQHHAA